MSSIKGQGHRSQNNRPKMADFRLKSRYLKKLQTDFNDFWPGKCRIQVPSLNVIKDYHQLQVKVTKAK